MTVDEVLQRTVGRWQICPLWIFRGKMFSPIETKLIVTFMDFWHSTGRPNWFYATNPALLRYSGLARNSFKKARRQLVQKCILQFKPGKRVKPGQGEQASAYHLSQDFLHSLAETPPLQTSTYSGGSKLDPMNRLKRMGVKNDPDWQ